ncbi:MAG: hypothetical protein FJ301_14520 [Planctomycetes bacterium]|nr:hypothetical protein [Planctomycetota bacterium]
MARSPAHVVFRCAVFSLAGLVLVFYGVGALLRDRWSVTSERPVPGAPATVAALVGDLHTWERWAAVQVELGPNTTRAVTGDAGKPGQRLVWNGPRGVAALEVTALDAAGMSYAIGFEVADGGHKATGRVEWAADGDRCRVRWRDEGVHANLFLRWFGWFGALQERVQQFQAASFAGLEQELGRAGAGTAR